MFLAPDPVDQWPRGPSTIKFDRTDGEHSRQAKITNQQAVWVVECAAAGVPPASLAAMLGVSERTVGDVCIGKRYGEATREARARIQSK